MKSDYISYNNLDMYIGPWQEYSFYKNRHDTLRNVSDIQSSSSSNERKDIRPKKLLPISSTSNFTVSKNQGNVNILRLTDQENESLVPMANVPSKPIQMSTSSRNSTLHRVRLSPIRKYPKNFDLLTDEDQEDNIKSTVFDSKYAIAILRKAHLEDTKSVNELSKNWRWSQALPKNTISANSILRRKLEDKVKQLQNMKDLYSSVNSSERDILVNDHSTAGKEMLGTRNHSNISLSEIAEVSKYFHSLPKDDSLINVSTGDSAQKEVVNLEMTEKEFIVDDNEVMDSAAFDSLINWSINLDDNI